MDIQSPAASTWLNKPTTLPTRPKSPSIFTEQREMQQVDTPASVEQVVPSTAFHKHNSPSPGTFPEDIAETVELPDASAVQPKTTFTSVVAMIVRFCLEKAWEYKFSFFTSLMKAPKTTVLAILCAILAIIAFPSLLSMLGLGLSIARILTYAIPIGVTYLITYSYCKPPANDTSFTIPLGDVEALPKERVRVMVRIMNAELSRLLDVLDGEEGRAIKLETVRLASLLETVPHEAKVSSAVAPFGRHGVSRGMVAGGVPSGMHVFGAPAFGTPGQGFYNGRYPPIQEARFAGGLYLDVPEPCDAVVMAYCE
ncbi:hypothetical protein P153DRAFT_361772 [Dothidotthia symphoricarpi CBS 119687]|uniref:Uncharacterized protein n=1 Tax=Dothidotthia symphoricarpi CBS 119687 TaxID=1392245 RepID=A0A6A5ZY29_9PLEO|nr:uncharacterized protein P153DRAFT_361772 [Dothidotthia symphoricarpi CBS 119687]KAF2123804.1 hypothetical protein P153DRAFT_361772 [Dothidotthia symphoricarpi CBS 119687]